MLDFNDEHARLCSDVDPLPDFNAELARPCSEVGCAGFDAMPADRGLLLVCFDCDAS